MFLISILEIVILALIVDEITFTLGYTIGFSVIRSVAGGYHAKSRNRCQILTIAVYLLSIFFYNEIVYQIRIFLMPCLALFSVILIYYYSPVDNSNKPFSKQEYIYYQKKSRIVVTILSILSGILGYLLSEDILKRLFYSIIWGIFTATISVVVAKVKYKGVN